MENLRERLKPIAWLSLILTIVLASYFNWQERAFQTFATKLGMDKDSFFLYLVSLFVVTFLVLFLLDLILEGTGIKKPKPKNII